MKKLIIICILLLSTCIYSNIGYTASVDGHVIIDTSNVLQDDFLGIGVHWGPYDEGLPTITPNQWDAIYDRVDYMEAKFARVMIGIAGEYPIYISGLDSSGNPIYDWDSSGMQKLYKILDYAQSRGVTVLLGEWNKPGFATSYTDSRWIIGIGDLLEHLRYTKGYTCIKHYNFVNEPNGSWTIPSNNWETWKSGVSSLYNELNNRGFLSWITISGPGSAYNDEWIDLSVNQIPGIIGDYDYHIYADTDDEIINGTIEDRVAAKRDLISRYDPQGENKHFFLGELGLKQGMDVLNDSQSRVYDFDYGVLMADAIIQAIRGGISGVIPWILDDANHIGPNGQLKRWGMWNTLAGHTIGGVTYPMNDNELRPWFYPMSLMSKFFPQGSKTLFVTESGVEGIRVAAAKIPNGDNWDLSVAIVNEQNTPKNINLRIPAMSNTMTLNQYNYFSNDRPVNSNGYPIQKNQFGGVSLRDGFDVMLPSRGVTFLTSIGSGALASLDSDGGYQITDELNDWSKTLGYSANWRFDTTNSWLMGGDTSRITRTTDSPESITYHLNGMKHFIIKSNYYQDNTDKLKVYSSPNNLTWSLVDLKWSRQITSDGSWYTNYYYPMNELPNGMNYLKVELGNDDLIWTPQIGSVKITNK